MTDTTEPGDSVEGEPTRLKTLVDGIHNVPNPGESIPTLGATSAPRH